MTHDEGVTRIISGDAGGRRLRTPEGEGTRPTSDRVREALFSSLEARDLIEGAHVMDLYARSGALGLEASSRGAASVLLVESDASACGSIRANIRDLGVAGARELAVGDGIITDIEGARRQGIDALFVTGGLAADQLGPDVEHPDPALLAAYLDGQGGPAPRLAIGRLR